MDAVFLDVGMWFIFYWWQYLHVHGLSMVVPKNKLGEYMGLLNLFIALPQFIFSNVYGQIIDNQHA